MAQFLTTTATNYHLEELVKNAWHFLVLISPYLDSGYRLFKDGIEELNNAPLIGPRSIHGVWSKQPCDGMPPHSRLHTIIPTATSSRARTHVLAAQTEQVKVLDHLIVSADQVFSFRKEGLL